jgi:hypothetical protein
MTGGRVKSVGYLRFSARPTSHAHAVSHDMLFFC